MKHKNTPPDLSTNLFGHEYRTQVWVQDASSTVPGLSDQAASKRVHILRFSSSFLLQLNALHIRIFRFLPTHHVRQTTHELVHGARRQLAQGLTERQRRTHVHMGRVGHGNRTISTNSQLLLRLLRACYPALCLVIVLTVFNKTDMTPRPEDESSRVAYDLRNTFIS